MQTTTIDTYRDVWAWAHDPDVDRTTRRRYADLLQAIGDNSPSYCAINLARQRAAETNTYHYLVIVYAPYSHEVPEHVDAYDDPINAERQYYALLPRLAHTQRLTYFRITPHGWFQRVNSSHPYSTHDDYARMFERIHQWHADQRHVLPS